MSALTFAGKPFQITPNQNPASAERRAEILADPGFGKHFSDHMIRSTWTTEGGWGTAELQPYGPLTLDPAAAVLHYAQEIFEGLKAYRRVDGSIWSFRPEANAARMQRSARRLALPELATEDFLAALDLLVATDAAWVPESAPGQERSYYLRPFMYASEPFLGVRPAATIEFLLIGCPVGSYFSGGVRPVSIWLSSAYTRAARGGTGEAKCGGNYAASLAPMLEAGRHGCDQVCFLDAAENRWVEELGGMNLYFVTRDGRLITPELGTILEGVTRSSILTLAKGLGLDVEERKVDIAEWRDGVASGEITEVFACGTAAVITPVGKLVWDGGEVASPNPGAEDSVTMRLRRTLVDLQYGRTEDVHGWMRRLV
ncbi:MAG: branched-chain amino acid aminotransferase [Kineosporiaceae bacterium]|nr:branched-chain amino acid aminotransferase [Kineosporiaceae bacterium]MBK8076211.1 branched-chain amino acid aminotransferase [Kineosporiaceae bacterium]